MTQKPVNKPSHEIFNVLGEGENTQWTKIGVAWTHKDGEGLNLAINSPNAGPYGPALNKDRRT